MNVILENEKRLCTVNEVIGYFHKWEDYAEPIAPGLMIGSHPGGQFSRTYGIVEFPDGVKRVEVYDIKFCDEQHNILCAMNEGVGKIE